VLRDRDDRAFGRLYDRHTAALYGLALRLVGGDEAAAQDAVHEAWMRAVPRLAEFRWEASLRTWLGAFVVRLARERWRRLAAEPLPLPDHGTATDDARLRGVFDRVDLERAIAALPDGFRQVLVLHDVEGFTHEEIAGLLDIVPGTSKSQLARARAALRRALGAPTGG
jgi:RNA polymerase sigma-70 factor (ECF subfamily)